MSGIKSYARVSFAFCSVRPKPLIEFVKNWIKLMKTDSIFKDAAPLIATVEEKLAAYETANQRTVEKTALSESEYDKAHDELLRHAMRLGDWVQLFAFGDKIIVQKAGLIAISEGERKITTFLPVPTNYKISYLPNGTPEVMCKAVKNATRYDLEWSVDNKTFVVLPSQPNARFILTGVTGGQIGYLRIRAGGANTLVSEWTDALSVMVPILSEGEKQKKK